MMRQNLEALLGRRTGHVMCVVLATALTAAACSGDGGGGSSSDDEDVIEGDGVSSDGVSSDGVSSDGVGTDTSGGDDTTGSDTVTGDIGTDTGGEDTVSNTAPTISFDAPADNTALVLGDSVDIVVSASDMEDALAELAFSVDSSVDGAVDLTNASLDTNAGTVTVSFTPAAAGAHTITATVEDTEGETADATLTLLVQVAPGAPVIEIAPADPLTGDDLIASVAMDAEDPDGNAGDLTYSYMWMKDDADSGISGDTVTADQTAKGETWKVVVTATDADGLVGAPGEASVQIGNTAPDAGMIAIVPDQVDLSSEVSCTAPVAASDADGDALTMMYAWEINEAPAVLAGGATPTNMVKLMDLRAGNDPEAGPESFVKVGDNVRCVLMVSDGAESASATSDNVMVGFFNVCESDLSPCDLNASCTNTDIIVPECGCNMGWAGDGTSCMDVDECADGVDACDMNATCTNTQGDYTCGCNDGYKGDGFGCDDINECTEGLGGVEGMMACDMNAACTNTVGSYDCSCNDGWMGDGTTCMDVDECAEGIDACDINAACTNTMGSYDCACGEGYEGDGFACSDINECVAAANSFDSPADLAGWATSSTTEGDGYTWYVNGDGALQFGNAAGDKYGGNTEAVAESPAWVVEPGQTLSFVLTVDVQDYPFEEYDLVDVELVVEGVPELIADKFDTDGNNTPTAFEFDLTPYAGKLVALRITLDTVDGSFNSGAGVILDDLVVSSGVCDANAACTNTDGSFSCACDDGYTGDGFACADVDECAMGMDACDLNAECSNTLGDYDCACNEGYDGDGFDCSDVDECAEGIDACDLNATCTNTVGDYGCACDEGYMGDGFDCANIDECAMDMDDCGNGATCMDTDGSFECMCDPGYLLDSNNDCVDINECAASGQVLGDFDDPATGLDGWMLESDTAPTYDWYINAFGELQFANAAGTAYGGNSTASAQSPAFMAQSGQTLAFDLTVDLSDYDGFFGSSYDLLDIYLVVDGVPELIGDKSDTDDNGVTTALAISLDEYAGKMVALRFEFDTVDDSFNSGAGVIIDNVEVTALPPCGENATCTNTPGAFECACDAGYTGDGQVCNVAPSAKGDLIITEFIANPAVISDPNGEWFEVYNASGVELDLSGLVIKSGDSGDHVISPDAPLKLANGAYAVFARNSNDQENGGVTAIVDYDGPQFVNSADFVTLESVGGVEIDTVAYDTAAGWTVSSGVALQFDGATLASGGLTPAQLADANDLPTGWCDAVPTYGTGDNTGSPGASNEPCIVPN